MDLSRSSLVICLIGIDHGIRHACGSANVEQPSRVVAQTPEKHGTVAGQCSLPCDARSASSSG